MRSKKRSPCPIAGVLDILGDRWTLLVVRDLFCGKSQYKDFAASPEKIATNILADRLQRLVKHGLVERYAPPQSLAGRDAYRLTKKGESLLPVVESMKEWGLKHIPGTEARMKQVVK
ncbi:MAG: winged helix-turn-helix transcriptional regulator [Pirellulales bacterium]